MLSELSLLGVHGKCNVESCNLILNHAICRTLPLAYGRFLILLMLLSWQRLRSKYSCCRPARLLCYIRSAHYAYKSWCHVLLLLHLCRLRLCCARVSLCPLMFTLICLHMFTLMVWQRWLSSQRLFHSNLQTIVHPGDWFAALFIFLELSTIRSGLYRLYRRLITWSMVWPAFLVSGSHHAANLTIEFPFLDYYHLSTTGNFLFK